MAEGEGTGVMPQLPPHPARAELSEHLDAMDSNLDNLQTMLSSHGFSVDTSALLDVSPTPPTCCHPPCSQAQPDSLPLSQLFSPSVTVPDMNLPDLDSSLASVCRVGVGWEEVTRVGEQEPSKPSCPSRSRSSFLPRSPPGLSRQRIAAPTQVSKPTCTPPVPSHPLPPAS